MFSSTILARVDVHMSLSNRKIDWCTHGQDSLPAISPTPRYKRLNLSIFPIVIVKLLKTSKLQTLIDKCKVLVQVPASNVTFTTLNYFITLRI